MDNSNKDCPLSSGEGGVKCYSLPKKTASAEWGDMIGSIGPDDATGAGGVLPNTLVSNNFLDPPNDIGAPNPLLTTPPNFNGYATPVEAFNVIQNPNINPIDGTSQAVPGLSGTSSVPVVSVADTFNTDNLNSNLYNSFPPS